MGYVDSILKFAPSKSTVNVLFFVLIFVGIQWYTLPKTNMDTQNDGLEKVVPFKHGNFSYLCWISGVIILKTRGPENNYQTQPYL